MGLGKDGISVWFGGVSVRFRWHGVVRGCCRGGSGDSGGNGLLWGQFVVWWSMSAGTVLKATDQLRGSLAGFAR